MPAQYPRDLELQADVSSMFNADGADQGVTLGRLHYPGIVNSVEFVPSWSLNGANTNSRTLVLMNRKSGTGTTTMCSLPLTSGMSLSRGVAVSMVVSSAAATVAVGDCLEWDSVHIGNGIPDPGGVVIVQQSITF